MALIGLCVKLGALLGDNVNGEDPHDHTWAILLAVSTPIKHIILYSVVNSVINHWDHNFNWI
jgi:hypothetical protein